MNAQDLKNSILQLAVQGKLVEQRAEEGTARELLEQIKLEKDQLIKDKKIKKSKPLPEITEDEIPFEIPETWEWVRVGEVGSLTRGSGIKRTEVVENGYPCVRYGELYTTYRTKFDRTVSFVDKELFDKCHKIYNGDVAMTLTGENKTDIAMAVTYEGDEPIAMGGDMTCWSHHMMNPLYLVYFINSPYAISCKRNLATGDIIIHISNDKLASILMPVPPLAEQQRIVAKIEEILPYIEQYDKAYTKLETFNKKFPEDMKKSILQLAMQGKLVEQRPEEGTADEQYEQIVAEKAQLIKDGKIKKEKPLPEITEDEIPFEIPASWKWVRFQEVCSVLTCGYASTPEYVSEDVGMPFISAKNIKPYRFMPEEHKYIKRELYDKLTQTCCPEKNDILLTRVGAGIGEAAIIDKDMEFAIYVSLTLVKLVDYNLIDNRYILYWLNSPIGTDNAKRNIFGKGASQGNLNVNNVRVFLVPLPPLAEQKRIVAKIEEMLPYCDQLIK